MRSSYFLELANFREVRIEDTELAHLFKSSVCRHIICVCMDVLFYP